MHAPLATVTNAQRRSVGLDLLVAAGLALILTIGWSITDWSRLSRMMLPDPDDMLRLAQVRDWIAGQGINDWTQYRMAPPQGSAMHWSRVNDFGIAALILLLTPLLGQANAELVTILVYPGMLFAAAIFLSARIGRRLWGPEGGPVAAILAAIAFPGLTVFIPGRIDHHALQAVLIQLLVLLLMRPATARTGAVAGAVAAIGLVVGLESAPQVVALVGVTFFAWVAGQPGAHERMGGFAVALAGVTLLFLIFLRPTFWSAQYCDAFTPASSTGTLAGAAALGVLAVVHPRLPGWRWRLGAGVVLGGIALGGTLLAYPVCINGPYGAVDPFLLSEFFPHIVEANGVFAQDGLAAMLAVGGLVATALIASAWMIARAPARWTVTAPIVAALGMSALVMLAQVRGAYIGAPLATPVLAGLILAARRATRWKLALLTGAWLVSAGLVWQRVPEEAGALFGGARISQVRSVQVACTVGDPWREVDRHPAGNVMTGTNAAAYLLASTRHSTVGAGYHRNNAANMAIYRFFLSAPGEAHAIARAWNVDYVVFCPGDFREIDAVAKFPDSMAARLEQGRAPEWLEPLPLGGTPLRLYRMR